MYSDICVGCMASSEMIRAFTTIYCRKLASEVHVKYDYLDWEALGEQSSWHHILIHVYPYFSTIESLFRYSYYTYSRLYSLFPRVESLIRYSHYSYSSLNSVILNVESLFWCSYHSLFPLTFLFVILPTLYYSYSHTLYSPVLHVFIKLVLLFLESVFL